MRLVSLAWKNLFRRPTRSLVTIVGLAIAVTAVVALVGVSESLESSFLDLYRERGADLVVQRKGGAVQLSKGIEQTFGDRMRALPNVREVVGCLMDMIAFEDHDLFTVLVNGWEPDSPVLDKIRVLEGGRRLRATDRRAVMLGRILAANLGKQAGDHIKLYGHDFQVLGVFESFSVYENGAVFMLLDDLQREMDRPGQVTGYVLQALDRSPTALHKLRNEIEELNPAVAATPAAEFVSSLSQMKLTRTMSWIVALIAVIVGSVGVLNTMSMAVFERLGEIAALRAMGWRKKRVMQMILCESLMLSLLGAALGCMFGFAVIQFLTHWKMTSGLVQGDFSWRSIWEGVAVAGGMGLLGAILPTLHGLRPRISNSLRGV